MPLWKLRPRNSAFIASPTAARMVTMARKGCHVFRILADLATVLLLIRCNTATSGMRALLCSGHQYLLSLILPSSTKSKISTDVVTRNAGGWVFLNHDIFLRDCTSRQGVQGKLLKTRLFRSRPRLGVCGWYASIDARSQKHGRGERMHGRPPH
jgi:hypothetical protein